MAIRVKISTTEMKTLGDFIKKESGIVLNESKAYLFESRLSPLLDKNECADYAALFRKVQRDISGKLKIKLIDAVCTNETSFFRDKSPFLVMTNKLFPDLYEVNASRTVKVLSAACSTGQEIYSMIMALTDAGICPPSFKMSLTAIDISDTAIAKASRGEYTKFELARGMNKDKLDKFFTIHEDKWRIRDEYRSLVRFRKTNLLKSPELKILGKFDIILCRNVAIYFSAVDKSQLFEDLANMLNPGGSLIIGSTESLIGISQRFTRENFHGGIYYKLKE